MHCILTTASVYRCWLPVRPAYQIWNLSVSNQTRISRCRETNCLAATRVCANYWVTSVHERWSFSSFPSAGRKWLRDFQRPADHRLHRLLPVGHGPALQGALPRWPPTSVLTPRVPDVVELLISVTTDFIQVFNSPALEAKMSHRNCSADDFLCAHKQRHLALACAT